VALLGASFQIGRSALAAYQAAIAVTGQNVANVSNPDYARQSSRLQSLRGGLDRPGLAPGGGVRLAALTRHIDSALESRLRFASATRTRAETTQRALAQVETSYAELGDGDLSTRLSEFFSTFGQLQTNPSDMGLRNLVVGGADALSRSFNRIRTGLLDQTSNLNNQVVDAAQNAGQLADEVASLNVLIVQQEADGTTAGALRDRRDAVIRDLGSIMDVQVREVDSGAVNIFVGSEPLVEFDRSRGLSVERVVDNGLEVTKVSFADNGGSVRVREGVLAGVLDARDVQIRDQLNRLDQLARGVIFEVNRIHSTGVGLVGYESATGDYAVTNPDAALNTPQAGLAFPVQNGSIIVKVRNRNTGQVTTRQVEVDLDGLNGDDMSLRDLATALNGVPGMSANVTADSKLQLDAANGNEFYFADDSSGALAALGVGGFFSGTSGSDIAIKPELRADRRLIAASQSGGVSDGDNAGRLALLASNTKTSALLNNISIQDFHAEMVDDLSVATAGAQNDFDAADAVFSGLSAQRESVSGVSLDEEAVNLTKFERAYQGAARFLTVLDDLSTELLALV